MRNTDLPRTFAQDSHEKSKKLSLKNRQISGQRCGVNTDKRYMELCLKLAKKGVEKASPNPMVGAVIVKDGKIVRKGYHRYFGGAHAEIKALKRAKGKANDAIMYINLEPCCHWGKTPPCVPEIIRAGIKKVVIAMKDPNPLVNGKGVKQLKVKGVRCKVGVLEKEAKELNRAYIKFITQKMPYVILKTAMSLDGKIATSTGESKWITSPVAREYVHRLRAEVDVVLVGINTIIKDNPLLTTHNQGCNPLRVVIDPDLQIPLGSRVLNKKAKTLIFTTGNQKNNSSKMQILKKGGIKILSLAAKNGRINFKQIMQELAKMNISSVLIEGGGKTNTYALEDKVVDEVMFFIAPKIIGGRDALTPVEGKGIKILSQVLRIKNLSIEKIGSDFLLKGKISFG